MALARNVTGFTVCLRSARVVLGQPRRFMASEAPAANDLEVSARKRYESLPNAFHNLTVDKIQFTATPNAKGTSVQPQVQLEGTDSKGLRHVTPWASVVFSYFGEQGNLGKETRFGKNAGTKVTDPMLAEQEVGLGAAPLIPGEEANEPMQQYFAWLNAVRAKFIDHLVANIQAYPVLEKKYSVLVAKGDLESVRGMLDQATSTIVKIPKVPKEGVRTTGIVSYRQRLYQKSFNDKKKPKPKCDLDKEMAAKGAVRRHVPLYDSHGTQIPLEVATVNSGDVVAVECAVLPQVYDVAGNVGASLKLQLRGVVLLRQRPNIQLRRGAQSPFGGDLIPGGVVFNKESTSA